jgi:hypothetical protein
MWRCSCLFAHAQLPAPAAEAIELPALSILELSAAKVPRFRSFHLICSKLYAPQSLQYETSKAMERPRLLVPATPRPHASDAATLSTSGQIKTKFKRAKVLAITPAQAL